MPRYRKNRPRRPRAQGPCLRAVMIARAIRELPQGAAVLYVAMAEASDPQLGETFIGERELADRTGRSRRWVRRWILRLIEAGWVQRLHPGRGRVKARVWCVIGPPPWEKNGHTSIQRMGTLGAPTTVFHGDAPRGDALQVPPVLPQGASGPGAEAGASAPPPPPRTATDEKAAEATGVKHLARERFVLRDDSDLCECGDLHCRCRGREGRCLAECAWCARTGCGCLPGRRARRAARVACN